jgi:imidazolonepropionase
MSKRLLLTNARIATLQGDALGAIERGAVVIEGERIAWVGEQKALPAEWHGVKALNCANGWLTPGLIDCHTHLVFAGNRADEFRRRAEGERYEAIARSGGGIVSTVSATRNATEDELSAQSSKRLKALMQEGVTSIEVKSGYGLDLATERKMLAVTRRLGKECKVHVATTFLGLHAVPKEFAGRRADYVQHVVEVMLPALHAEGLVDAVDAFCEHIGFTREETETLFGRARDLGLPVKLHAEQLSNQHGSALAARYGGLSADHLEHLDGEGIAAMRAAGTVAVLLPAAFYVLRETRIPPVEALRCAGVPMAVASDLNPGTAPVVSLLASMHMACTLFRLTPTEALRGVTVNAARALGRADHVGRIAAGLMADLCLWDIESPAELCYWLGGMKPSRVWFAGEER